MASKISINVNELQKQQQQLSGLAQRTDEQQRRYSGLLDKMTNAIGGKISLNISIKSKLSKNSYKKLSNNLGYGAKVAQTCIDAFYSTDQKVKDKAQNMNQVIANDPIYNSNSNSSGNGGGSAVPPSNQVITGSIIDKMKNDPRYQSLYAKTVAAGYSGSKLAGMQYAMAYMLDAGYEEAFIIGIMANIAAEGSPGRLENSSYKREKEPKYLIYVDDNHNYRQEFSNKTITEVGLDKVENLVNSLKNEKGTSASYFGIGCIQWTYGNRVNHLIECYREVCGSENHPSAEMCAQAEALYLCRELQGYYKDANYSSVYNSWKNQYGGQNTPEAATGAADIICRQYEKPAHTDEASAKRQGNASKIYNS